MVARLNRKPSTKHLPGHLHGFCVYMNTYQIVWIDPYLDQNNRNIDGVVDLTTKVDVYLQEQRNFQIYAMVQVIRIFMNIRGFEFTYVMILQCQTQSDSGRTTKIITRRVRARSRLTTFV